MRCPCPARSPFRTNTCKTPSIQHPDSPMHNTGAGHNLPAPVPYPTLSKSLCIPWRASHWPQRQVRQDLGFGELRSISPCFIFPLLKGWHRLREIRSCEPATRTSPLAKIPSREFFKARLNDLAPCSSLLQIASQCCSRTARDPTCETISNLIECQKAAGKNIMDEDRSSRND